MESGEAGTVKPAAVKAAAEAASRASGSGEQDASATREESVTLSFYRAHCPESAREETLTPPVMIRIAIAQEGRFAAICARYLRFLARHVCG